MPETNQDGSMVEKNCKAKSLPLYKRMRIPYINTVSKPKRMSCILPHLMNRQVTGKSVSQSKSFLVSTIKCLHSTVKPRRLQDLVKSVRHLNRRVFLGFLRGSYWFVSYQYLGQDEQYFATVPQVPRHAASDCFLEFWLYHPNKPLELMYVRNLFTDLGSCCISWADELILSIYQWVDDSRHLLVFGARVIYDHHERVNKGSLLSITYLPVPDITSSKTCPMCLKSRSESTFGCVVHNFLLNFFGPVDSYDQLEAEKHLKIPNIMYLNILDQQLYCVSMSHRSLSTPLAIHNQYGNFVSNIRTTVYSGHTTSNASEVSGVSDPCDEFSVNCITNNGQHYLPVKADEDVNPLHECLIVRRSWIELQLLIIDEVYPIMSEKTSWFNADCVLKDWKAEYIEICAETGKAICEMTFKIGEDPRYFDHLDRHICSVTFVWDVESGGVEISQFDEGILVTDSNDELGEARLYTRAKNPAWVAKLREKHQHPQGEKAVIELNNLPVMRGESLTALRSLDRTAVITL